MEPGKWPTNGAKLFVDSGGYYEFAHFGWGSLSDQFAGYAQGYKAAADCLIDHAVASREIREIDSFVYPVLFLYRQYIELELKWLSLAFSNSTLQEKRAFLADTQHDILVAREKVVPLLKGGGDERDLDAVRSYLVQFHALDRSSFTFRYPISKNLDLTVGEQHCINLVNLMNRMAELEAFFTGAESYLIDRKSFEADMQQCLSDM